MIRLRRTTVTILAILTGLSAALFAPLLTYREVPSPDGEFVAIAKASLFFSLVPVMPGQAGDKPGRITIVRKDGAVRFGRGENGRAGDGSALAARRQAA